RQVGERGGMGLEGGNLAEKPAALDVFVDGPPLRIRSVPLLTTYMDFGGSPSANSTCPLCIATCGSSARRARTSVFWGAIDAVCAGPRRLSRGAPGLFRRRVR